MLFFHLFVFRDRCYSKQSRYRNLKCFPLWESQYRDGGVLVVFSDMALLKSMFYSRTPTSAALMGF